MNRFSQWMATAPGRLTGLALGTALALVAGLVTWRWLLPLLPAAVVFPAYSRLVRQDRWWAAVGTALWWAIVLALLVGALTLAAPDIMRRQVVLGESYRIEMFHWVATGEGRESDISEFLPQHLLHLLVFSILTLASGGFLGLVMGAVLMNYMSFYVGALVGESPALWPVAALAWPPWAMLRVAAFVILATALSGLLYDRLGLMKMDLGRFRRFCLLGMALILADIVLKWLLAPLWRQWLKSLTGL